MPGSQAESKQNRAAGPFFAHAIVPHGRCLKFATRSSSREVKISWRPIFSVVYFSRGLPSQPKKKGQKKRHLLGDRAKVRKPKEANHPLRLPWTWPLCQQKPRQVHLPLALGQTSATHCAFQAVPPLWQMVQRRQKQGDGKNRLEESEFHCSERRLELH